MKKILSIAMILMLLCCGCTAEEVKETAPITDAATFAEAAGFSGEMPTAILLDDAAFGKLITEGSGVAFIADPEDAACRLLSPVLFAQMKANNSVLQLYLPADASATEGLMERILNGGIAITGDKALAEAFAENGEIPYSSVLYMKEGKIVAAHIGSLPGHDPLSDALTDEEITTITDMLQFQLDKLLAGTCESGC